MKAVKAIAILSAVFVGFVSGCQSNNDCPADAHCDSRWGYCTSNTHPGPRSGSPGMNIMDGARGPGSFLDYCYSNGDCTQGKYCHQPSHRCVPMLRSGPRRMAVYGCDRICRPNWICDGFKCIPRLHHAMRCNSDFECDSGICDYDTGRCA